MAFIDEFTKAQAEIRATMDELNHKMMKLEDIIQDHFSLTHKPVPASIMKNIEKDIKSWPSTISEHSPATTK